MADETLIRRIRGLIPDTDAVFGPDDDAYMFTDTELEDFYAVGRNSILRGAAYAVYAVASSEALISKKIKTQDLMTDGPAVADALRKHGDALMARADKDDKPVEEFFQIINYGDGWCDYPMELTERAQYGW